MSLFKNKSKELHNHLLFVHDYVTDKDELIKVGNAIDKELKYVKKKEV